MGDVFFSEAQWSFITGSWRDGFGQKLPKTEIISFLWVSALELFLGSHTHTHSKFQLAEHRTVAAREGVGAGIP